eukprot:SAG11_NODE_801_length_7112_cov_6.438329_5_plen_132_part_00
MIVPGLFLLSGILLVAPIATSFDISKKKALSGSDRWHFFLSHSQETGGNQAQLLHSKLTELGFKVWYDNDMDEVNTAAMARGVQESACVILFLSKGIFTRPFVQCEVRVSSGIALVCCCPLVVVQSTASRS